MPVHFCGICLHFQNQRTEDTVSSLCKKFVLFYIYHHSLKRVSDCEVVAKTNPRAPPPHVYHNNMKW